MEQQVRRPPTVASILNVLDKSLPADANEFAQAAPEQDDITQGALSDKPRVETPEKPETPEAPVKTEVAAPAEAPVVTPPTEASAPPDPWADAEEIEIEDADTNRKFKIKAPKDAADYAKRGYERHSSFSRKSGYLSKYRDTLEPLITSGRFDDLAQMIRLGEEQSQAGNNFRNAMYEAYYRATTGRPMTFADQVQQAARENAEQQTTYSPEEDPLGLKQALDPLIKDVASIKAEREQQAQLQAQRQQYTTWANQAAAQAQAQTYAEFATLFPGEFSGNVMQDEPKMKQIADYAQNAGLFTHYNPTNDPRLLPGIMRMAKYEYDKANAPAPATPSVAQDVASMAEQTERLAREAGARLAATTAPGNAVTPNARPKPKEKVPMYDKNGRKRPINTFLQDLVAQQAESA